MASRTAGLERITTGVLPLDAILGGGIPRYSTTFIAGPPGTGKTVLCQQALFANARKFVPALYLGTVTEPVLKMLRHVQGFSFFEAGRVGKDVVYGDLGSTLTSSGPDACLAQIDALIKAHRPEFLVIDSFKVMSDFIRDPVVFRKFLSDLVLMLATWEVTTFVVGEYSNDDILSLPEFAIADGIIFLSGTEEPRRQKRFLRIMKMRGTNYFSGEHIFEITSEGFEIFPRMDPYAAGEYAVPGARVRSSIEGLSEMIGGGIEGATACLIAGSSGSGKSLAALSFLVGNAREGNPGLFVSFEERPDQLIRNAGGFGWNLQELVQDKLLDLLHVSPSELDIDRHAVLFRERAEAINAKVVVIDTISAIEASLGDIDKGRSYFWAITDYFKRRGVTILMTHESSNFPTESNAKGLSFVADSMIQLRVVEVDGIQRRTVSVLKMRGTNHDKSVREFFIESPNVRVGDVFRRTPA